MRVLRSVFESIPGSRKSLFVTAAALVVVAATVLSWDLISRAGPTPATAAAPHASTTRGTEADTDADKELPPPQRPTVVVVRPGKHSAVLADSSGLTLYTFSGDGPRTPRCTGACAKRWRPALSLGGKPQAADPASAADVGSVRRADGGYQVTFRGWPLYYFVGDTRAGDETGSNRNEFGGHWSPVPPLS
jgi:predicted lipoprotein with Yx(FWY)xxD motif